MNSPVLDQLFLGAGTLFDARRQPMATRLTLQPIGSHAADGPALLAHLEQVWPAEAGALWLNPTREDWVDALLPLPLPPHVWLEVPAFLAGDPARAALWSNAAAPLTQRVLKGRLLAPLPIETHTAFNLALVQLDELRQATSVPIGLPTVHAGHENLTQISQSFRQGAQGVLGWPLGEAPDINTRRKDVPAGVSVVMNLIQLVEREAPAPQLEAVLRRDPGLAYRLMRFINSPGFGLSVEINSFQHALLVLGYQRLKRWLALLLTSAIDNPDLKPLMFLAVRRALLMEELARAQDDEALRNELFICGVFSLLDRMLAQPFRHLLDSLPVPQQVAAALVEGEGPHRPWLELAMAVEAESPFDIREAAERLMLSPADLNRALLSSLRTAWQMRVD